MRDSVTIRMSAPPEAVWSLVSDVTRIGEFSPETLEGEWLDGATGPAPGGRFRGHVKRNGKGPMYWTICNIKECEPGRSFSFTVMQGKSAKPVTVWAYHLVPVEGGTDVTESYALEDRAILRGYWRLFGKGRAVTNARNMRQTLERMKSTVESQRPTSDAQPA